MEIIPSNILELGQAVTTAFIIYLIIKEVLNKKKNGNGKQDEKQNINLAVIDERLKSIESQISNHIMHKLEQNDIDHLKIETGIAKMEAKMDMIIEKLK